MVEPSMEPISSRCSKLNQIFAGKHSSISNKNLVSREGLLDALFLLYDECNNDTMKKDKHVALFIDKFRSAVTELKKLRVNISDFEVRKIIGRGHFGEVQVVREKQTGDVYAMKILRKSNTLAQQNMAFYEEERDIMAKAHSPWITQLQYAFQDHNNLYLIMEFHPGGDLLALLDRMETLSEEMTRFYMAEIVLAIHSLHTMGYVHRDIKPDNILIDRMGHIKLADFGSAAKLTAAGTVVSEMPVGTPDYIAPEVLAAMNATDRHSACYGRECDWWSLGVVGYEMLCGRTPFADDKVVITYSNIMDHENTLKWPDDVEFNPETKSVIRGLLEEANKRYDYKELCQNKFFSSIDWTNLRSTVPPFLPKVTSQDDTSNFEEFEKETPPPSLDNYKVKKEFHGKNLPFIGFTFTHNLVPKTDRASIGRNSPRGSTNVTALEVQLSNKRQEVQELQQQLHNLQSSENGTKQELEQLKRQLASKEKAVEGVLSDREKLEQSLTKYSNDVNKLKRVLELERSDRLSTEKTALQLVSDVKAKWQREKAELIKELQNRKEFIIDIEAQFLNTKTKELKYHKEIELLKQTLEKNRLELEGLQKEKLAKVSGKKSESSEVQATLQKLTSESQSQMSELQQSLKQKTAVNQQLQNKLQELESTLGHVERQLKVVETEHGFCQSLVETTEETYKVQLRQAEEKCRSLEARLREVEKAGKELPVKEATIQNLEKKLAEERESTKKMKSQVLSLESRVNTSQQFLERREGCLQNQEKELVDRMQDLEHDMRQSANEKIQLRQELEASEEREFEQLQRIEEQQNVIKSLEEKLSTTTCRNEALQKAKEEASAKISKETLRVVKEVSSDFTQEKLFLETKISKLESQLDRSRELFSSEKLKLKAAQEELRKVQQELSDSKIDVRIAQREVKRSHEKIETLEVSDKTWESRLKETEEQIGILQEKQESLTSQIQKLEKQLEEKRQDMVRQEDKYEREKSKLESRVQGLEEACKASQELRAQVGRAQGQYEELCRQNKILEDQILILERNKRHQHQSDDAIRNELQEKTRKLANLELNVEVLKTTCMTMDDQLKDYERLVTELQRQNSQLTDEKLSLESELDAASGQVHSVLQKLQEAKSSRAALEDQIRNLQNKLEAATAVQQVEASTLKEQLSEQKCLTGQFHEQLNETESCLAMAEHAQKKYQRRVEVLEEENLKLKEEVSEMITRERSLRDSNFKLTLGLEEAIEKCEASNSRVAELENAFETMQVTHEVERIKLEATVSQQTKLIDFLQTKAEGFGKKKKTLQDKLFGRCARIPSFDPFIQRREKEMTLTPKPVSRTTRGDVRVPPKHGWDTPVNNPTTPKSRAVLSAIIQSPGMQRTPEELLGTENKGEPKPAKERMRHNIPHRFQVALTMRATKCSACLDTIHFGRSSARCQECHIMAHPKCSSSLPSTCGLPTGLVQHFRQSIRRKNSTLSDSSSKNRGQQKMEGWIKLPRSRNMSWEQKYARLEGSRLGLYDKENMNSNTPTNEVELCPPTGQVIVHSAVTASELLSTAKSDLPYILKLEAMPHTTCWPGRTLYLMAPSFPEKQSWVNALECVTRLCVEQVNNQKSAKLLGTTILQLEEDKVLDLNCSWQLSDKVLLVGAEEGLFVVELKERAQTKPKLKLEGIEAVFQIAIIEELDCVLMITDASRDLCHLKLSDLRTAIDTPSSCSDSLSPEAIPNTQPCHLFATSHNYDESYICAATSEKVVILKWCSRLKFFSVCKELMTAEPSSCIYFTKHSIIVGADKFFEIDLKTFSADEFLDASDSSLAYAVYGTAQANSFPVAVMHISPPGASDEFLLCFHEFGIFVDGFGRRTRKSDMKWTRLPLAFAYQAPYMFVAHFSSMEVLEITAQKENRKGKTTYLEVSGPRYLGPALKEGTVYMASIHDSCVSILCLQGNLAELSEPATEEINDTESETTVSEEVSVSDCDFSYTSSVLKAIEPSPGDFSEDFTEA